MLRDPPGIPRGIPLGKISLGVPPWDLPGIPQGFPWGFPQGFSPMSPQGFPVTPKSSPGGLPKDPREYTGGEDAHSKGAHTGAYVTAAKMGF